MRKFVSIFIILTSISCSSFAQANLEFVFRVLANKGSNKVKRAEGGQKLPLRPGMKLMTDDEIITASGAYIGLMHKTGRTIEVRTTGITSIKELESKLANSKRSVADKYANFVMQKMNQGDGDVNDNYRRNMKATGAVERASSTAISAMLPNSVSILNSKAVIRWNSVGENSTYIFSVQNIFDEEMYSAETTKTYMSIDLDDENLASERLVIVSIKVKDNLDLFSPAYGIERLSDEDSKSIKKSLNQLKSELSLDNPLDKLILASFYEEKNLIMDALTEYESVIEMSPEVEDFKVIYGEFLLRNGLSR